MSENELVVLLVQARENNRRDGITGMLIYADGWFLQAIEGPEYAIEDLWARLGEDTRHDRIEKLREETIARRAFEDWTMGFRAVSAADVNRLLDLAGVVRGGADGATALGVLGELGQGPGEE